MRVTCSQAGLALWLPAAALARPATDRAGAAAIDAFVETQRQRHGIQGLALAVVRGDEILHVQGYGTAGGGRTVVPETPFYLGSVPKSFTALAAMQLVEAGRLELDRPVQDYLPWFEVADPQASAQITVRHLLNQTSGLSRAGYTGPDRPGSELCGQSREAGPSARPHHQPGAFGAGPGL
jgi:CubicO group peptidase (beta-lactamase class C family)